MAKILHLRASQGDAAMPARGTRLGERAQLAMAPRLSRTGEEEGNDAEHGLIWTTSGRVTSPGVRSVFVEVANI